MKTFNGPATVKSKHKTGAIVSESHQHEAFIKIHKAQKRTKPACFLPRYPSPDVMRCPFGFSRPNLCLHQTSHMFFWKAIFSRLLFHPTVSNQLTVGSNRSVAQPANFSEPAQCSAMWHVLATMQMRSNKYSEFRVYRWQHVLRRICESLAFASFVWVWGTVVAALQARWGAWTRQPRTNLQRVERVRTSGKGKYQRYASLNDSFISLIATHQEHYMALMLERY